MPIDIRCVCTVGIKTSCCSCDSLWACLAKSAWLCRPDCILVLDTWFMLVVHYGKTIVEWRKAGYHLQPDQDGFR